MVFLVPVIGDAHFRSDERQADRLASVEQILNECKREPVGFWAIPGDLYDAGSDVKTRNAWVALIQRMALKAPVVIAYGNHDRDGDLDMLAELKGAYPIHVFNKPQVIELKTPQNVVMSVFVLPYPHPSGLVAAGTPTGDVVAAARGLLDVIFMDAGARLIAAEKRGQPTLMIGHANVGGSKMSTGQPLIGREIELDEQLMLRLGNCPKVLNHIHLPQEIGGAVLAGSITAMSWGETEAKRYVQVEFRQPSGHLPWKGVVEVLETMDGRKDLVLECGHVAGWPFGDTPSATKCIVCDPPSLHDASPDWEWRILSCPLKTPQLVLVEALFDNDRSVELSAFEYDIQPSDVPAGADVRVRVRFQETERQFFEFGRAEVEAAFSHARRLQIEPICLADKGLRSPEVAAAKTLQEKLLAWCAANGEPAPEGLVAAVGELETKPADLVISEFRSRMSALLKE